MGVPAFFRWLSRKYPSIVVNCNERKPQEVDGVTVPVDATEPNPMGVEFDNLYLDMNGIIHPCTHPEHKPQPKNEDEMFVNIFEYIDRLFDIVRPRRVLYMAIDGVAPRAKMNQQRSRRFRAAKESFEKQEEINKVRDRLEREGMPAPPPKAPGEHFDSNCITPGTPFMARLAVALRYYIHDRQQTNKAWQSITVILSDANVPGEGEHKIMDFIRKQRGQPDHDPNTHHCLCGADADLIMLGLATHEPNFTIIREEFIPNKQKPCELCNQYGHELKECQGMPRGDFSESDPLPQGEANFIFIRLNVLREYLERELQIPNLPFNYDLERAIDDWVFMCFFVGNDFLPHLPSLEIREGAIDRLIRIYKKTIYRTQGYLTDSGVVNLSRVQLILSDLGEMEDEIFKDRQETELGFRKRAKDRKRRAKAYTAPAFIPEGQFAPLPLGGGSGPVPLISPLKTSINMRKQAMSTSAVTSSASVANGAVGKNGEAEQRGVKRKLEDSDDDEPPDEVRLWEEGWKERYYQSKFEVSASDSYFRFKVVNAYVEGLAWVLRYYYQGCSSWKWYFPFHYAPFASDFLNIGDIKIDFTALTEPFKPVEQLMGVFPAASRKHVPECFGQLMYDPDSPIIDFYPTDFMVDLNGKKWAWMGVALLPFVEEKRLLAALQEVYPLLTPDEKARNVRGNDRLFVSSRHPSFTFVKEAIYGDGDCSQQWLKLMPALFKGMGGEMMLDNSASKPGGILPAVIPGTPDLVNIQSVCVEFRDPQYSRGFMFKSCFLPGAKMPERTLKPGDWDEKEQRGVGRGFIPGDRGGSRGGRGRGYTPMIGFTRDRPEARMGDAGHRMLGAAVGLGGRGGGGGGQYGNVPPPRPLMHNRSSSYGGGGGGWGAGRDHQQARPADEDRNFRSSGYSTRGGGGYGEVRPRGGGQTNPPVAWQQSMRHQAQAFQQNLYSDLVRDQYNNQGGGWGGRGGMMGPPAAKQGSWGGQQQQQSRGFNNNNRRGGGRW